MSSLCQGIKLVSYFRVYSNANGTCCLEKHYICTLTPDLQLNPPHKHLSGTVSIIRAKYCCSFKIFL